MSDGFLLALLRWYVYACIAVGGFTIGAFVVYAIILVWGRKKR